MTGHEPHAPSTTEHDAVLDRVTDIVTRLLRLQDVGAPGSSDDLWDLGMDSLGSVAIMAAVEDEFELEFPDALLVRSTFESIDAIARHTLVVLADGGSDL